MHPPDHEACPLDDRLLAPRTEGVLACVPRNVPGIDILEPAGQAGQECAERLIQIDPGADLLPAADLRQRPAAEGKQGAIQQRNRRQNEQRGDRHILDAQQLADRNPQDVPERPEGENAGQR